MQKPVLQFRPFTGFIREREREIEKVCVICPALIQRSFGADLMVVHDLFRSSARIIHDNARQKQCKAAICQDCAMSKYGDAL